ncbi:unnamed protein product [Moneuplotes crassus]|uniref:SAM domain-containing protein n=3 Tax=Euplotes crassus TaxID=5936 RepID=A0AAD1X8Z3_EUPCR|nr:unnamed protein product [Moneuplotes crassus]
MNSRAGNSRGKPRKSKPANKKLLPSQILELEAQRREQELIELRKKMREDQQRKFKQNAEANGNHWKSGTKSQKLHGYAGHVGDQWAKGTDLSYSNPQSAQLHKRAGSRQSTGEGQIIHKGLNIKNSKQSTGNQISIESNFNKALNDQNNDYKEVDSFLGEIKMEKYKDVFIDNGIEDRETIMELKEEHLEQMNLPLGHKLKIMKRIKDINKKKNVAREQVRKQEEIKTSMAASTSSQQNSSNLLDGVYDEEENKKEFQQALEAWRNAGQKESALKHPSSAASSKGRAKKNVRFAEDPPEEVLILNNQDEPEEDNEATLIPTTRKPTTEIKEGMVAFKGLSMSKNSFLYSEEASGSNVWNANLLSTVDNAETSPMEEMPLRASTPKIEKELCNQCYKYVDKSLCEKDSLTKKMFCSMDCQANFFMKNVGRCSNEECDKYFMKKDGLIVNKEWYCSTECGSKGFELLNREEEVLEEEIGEEEEAIEIDLTDFQYF